MKSSYRPNLKQMPLSSLFYALSDPARLRIVQILLEETEMSCGQCSEWALSKSTMSHHFKVLRESGLLEKRAQGRTHHLSIRRKEIEERLPGLLALLKRAKRPY